MCLDFEPLPFFGETDSTAADPEEELEEEEEEELSLRPPLDGGGGGVASSASTETGNLGSFSSTFPQAASIAASVGWKLQRTMVGTQR